MGIEELRSQLKDVNAQVEAARKEGIRMATDKGATTEQMSTQRATLEALLERQGLLKSLLQEALDEGGEKAKPVKGDVDAVSKGAQLFRSSGDFFSTVARDRRDHDPRLAEYTSIRSAATGQNLTTDAEGGYLVPPEYTNDLLKLAQTESVLYPEVRRVGITGNSLITTRRVETTREDTTKDAQGNVTNVGRNSGLLAYWVAEAAEYTAEKLHFQRDSQELHKLTGLAYATDEMLEDYAALAGIIAEGFRDEFSFQIDDAILWGTGIGKPLGVLDVGNTALVTVPKDSGQAAGTLTLDNILNMYNAMPARNRARARWYMNQDMEMTLMKLLLIVGEASSTGGEAVEQIRSSMGVPLYIPAGGLSGAPYSTLLGRPVVPVEQCSGVGEKGDLLFADLSQYRWIDKGGMTSSVSVHVRFLFDEQAFKFTYRAGGKPTWPNAIKAYKGGTLRSPYVALAARQ